jgi:hypothetical protein
MAEKIQPASKVIHKLSTSYPQVIHKIFKYGYFDQQGYLSQIRPSYPQKRESSIIINIYINIIINNKGVKF